MISKSKNFAEFFAGIGLVRLGLAPTGWKCVFANDIDPKKQEMYAAAFGQEHYHCGDIWESDRMCRLMPQGVTLATASFPCTDLSLAGHWRGINGKHSSAFFGFTELLRRMNRERPPIVLVENVAGLLTSNGGADFGLATQELASLGYWLDALLIDARAFVPQSRPRVFIVGVLPHLKSAPIFQPATDPFGSLFQGAMAHSVESRIRPGPLMELRERTKLTTGWLAAALPPLPCASPPLGNFLDHGGDHQWWTAENVAKHLAPMQAPSRDRLNQLVNEDLVRHGTAFRRTRLGESRTEVRFDIAGCLRTPKGGSARQIVIRVGRGAVDMRWMTAREYARLQGAAQFPITVPERQALFGFGDAVCVPVIEWLDTHLLTPVANVSLSKKPDCNGRVPGPAGTTAVALASG
jgi:DNA (cytosine-5)-methyltransferase 1